MQIWVDADACPRAIREILYRAAERVRVVVTLVANRPPACPRSPYIRTMQVPAGFDEADRRIVEILEPGDLVITADVPLAAAAVEKGALVLGPRGEELTEDNVHERLATRDLLDQLRSEGLETSGPAAFGRADQQTFANALDRLLTRHAGGGAGR